MNVSKSRYCAYLQCPKRCWLDVHKREECVIDAQTQQRLDDGNVLGDMAMGYFGDFIEVTTIKPDGTLDIAAMIRKTNELLQSGADNICEASFSHNGLFCSVDILHEEKGGYAIYEVKSSKHIKEINYHDVAFQKYVLEHCGINVTGVYIVHLNGNYVRQGEIDIHKLFVAESVLWDITDKERLVEAQSALAKAMLDNQQEPQMEIDAACEGCGYWAYCTKDLPQPSVLNIRGRSDKWMWYKRGIRTMGELSSSEKLSEKQQRQVAYELQDFGTYVDKRNLRQFLDTLSLPLYFLDFETMCLALPPFDGIQPSEHIPFQYSLHWVEREDGQVREAAFLADPAGDPRRALAEQLCKDVPRNVCVLAWSASVEKGIVAKLAALFPDLAEHLMNIHGNILDLEVPFRKQMVYNRAMQGRSSIKFVLPAMFPNDPTADYHNLEGVHNGTEAMTIFPKMKDMSAEQLEKARKSLLDYCALDTRAMARIWQELVKLSK